jgi:hypothetical protein
MTASTKAHGCRRPVGIGSLAELIEQVRSEQSKIGQDEGRTVSCLARIGALLNEIQIVAGRTWTKLVAELGYHPRAATRYQRLGASWIARIGTTGSEFLNHLPSDIQKLDWLCRLTPEQLRVLLQNVDLKNSTRNAVKGAVKAVLGIPSDAPTTRGDIARILKLVDRFSSQMIKALECLDVSALDNQARQRIQALLEGCLKNLHVALDKKGANASAANNN